MDPVTRRLEQWVDADPDRTLYTFLNVEGEVTSSYSYQGFLERSIRLAGHLRHVREFDVNDRLILSYPPGLEMMVAFFACIRAGLIPVPVTPPGRQATGAARTKMNFIAENCGAAALLTDREGFRQLNARRNETGVLAGPMADNLSNLPCIVTDDVIDASPHPALADQADLLFLQYTSGSTSQPKGVMVGHETLLHNCERVVFHPQPVTVSWLPQHHDMGLIGYYLFTALSGGTNHGFSPTTFIQRPSLWLDTITRYQANGSSAPNFAFDYCLRPGRISPEAMASFDLSSLLCLMAAAEPIKRDTYDRFLRTFQPRGLKPESFMVAYGLAENTLAVSNFGRSAVSVSRKALNRNQVRLTREAEEVVDATHLMSCGKPLDGCSVKIVDPERHSDLGKARVGEIWISGGSKCLGYWGKPDLSRSQFGARLAEPDGSVRGSETYLRSGDLGFLLDGELYVCGRLKDMIIVRGQNYYPTDIEAIIENSTDLVREGSVAAFEVEGDHGPEVAIVAEAKRPSALPDAVALAASVRTNLDVEVGSLALVPAKSLPKTSSGKIMRHRAKQLWEDGAFDILSGHRRQGTTASTDEQASDASPLAFLRARYGLTGEEPHSLLDVGLESLDLVIAMHEIKQFLQRHGAEILAKQVDVRLIQEIPIVQLFRLSEYFEQSPESAVREVQAVLRRMKEEQVRKEHRCMKEDAKLSFRPSNEVAVAGARRPDGTLLTGGTGFLGPFLVAGLLEQTEGPVHVLVRAADEARAMERLTADLANVLPKGAALWEQIGKRIRPICGDLGKANLGLSDAAWADLAQGLHTIYHNAAAVNYLFTYDRMRGANVSGTNEILRLAFDHHRKVFNYISTTFIFGWATKDVLYETDANENLDLLDFGYSQSKWVSERVVADAARHGLTTRIFRPALIAPSPDGGGNNLDIVVRLLAFMIKHGIGVTAWNQISLMPADLVANNIVAISTQRGTENQTFHVTTDKYYTIMDITSEITRQTGRGFKLFSPSDFVPEVVKRCTRDDLLYPLMDFLIGSVDNITSMEFKRYDSARYQSARLASNHGRQDASLERTVSGLLQFMRKQAVF